MYFVVSKVKNATLTFLSKTKVGMFPKWLHYQSAAKLPFQASVLECAIYIEQLGYIWKETGETLVFSFVENLENGIGEPLSCDKGSCYKNKIS